MKPVWMTHRVHLNVGSPRGWIAACGTPNPKQAGTQRNRIDCKRCLRTKAWDVKPPNDMAIRRIVANKGFRESDIVAYVPSAGAFVYLGPLLPAIELVLEDRHPQFGLDPWEGKWMVAFSEDPDGNVFEEWGFGPTAEWAWRFAIAAYLDDDREAYLLGMAS